MKKLSPIHPGEILSAEFIEPKGISQSQLARAINVPPRRINEICLGKRGITPDTALRLGRYPQAQVQSSRSRPPARQRAHMQTAAGRT